MKLIWGSLIALVISTTAFAGNSSALEFRCYARDLSTEAYISLVLGQTTKETKVFVHFSGRGYEQVIYSSFGEARDYSTKEYYALSKDMKAALLILKGERIWSEDSVNKNGKVTLQIVSSDPLIKAPAGWYKEGKAKLVVYPEKTQYFDVLEQKYEATQKGIAFDCTWN